MSCVDAGQALARVPRGHWRPSVVSRVGAAFRFLSAWVRLRRRPTNLGRGLSKFACWGGSGPSDPLRHDYPIGSASTRRLAKIVKMERPGLTHPVANPASASQQGRSKWWSREHSGTAGHGAYKAPPVLWSVFGRLPPWTSPAITGAGAAAADPEAITDMLIR